MTSEEVIERLRNWPFMGKAMASASADHIEELIAERDEAWRRAAHAEKMWGETEVKLAKAVAIAEDAIETMESGPFFPEEEARRFRTTLAELTGGKNG